MAINGNKRIDFKDALEFVLDGNESNVQYNPVITYFKGPAVLVCCIRSTF